MGIVKRAAPELLRRFINSDSDDIAEFIIDFKKQHDELKNFDGKILIEAGKLDLVQETIACAKKMSIVSGFSRVHGVCTKARIEGRCGHPKKKLRN